MSMSCICSADVDDITQTNQSIDINILDENDGALLLSCTGDKPSDNGLYLNSENSLSNSENILSNSTTDSAVNDCNIFTNSTIESFNNPNFMNNNSEIAMESFCLSLCLCCSNGNMDSEDNTLLCNNDITDIDFDISDKLTFSCFDLNNQNIYIINYAQINKNIMTLPKNLDEEEQIRYQIFYCSQVSNDIINLTDYTNSVNTDTPDDFEKYDLTLNVEDNQTINYTTPDYPDSENIDSYGMGLNNSYYEERTVLGNKLERPILFNSKRGAEESNLDVENLFDFTALTFNNNMADSLPQDAEDLKIAITESITFNNSISSNNLNQNGEAIFNQEATLSNCIIEDIYEEELTQSNTTIELFNLNLSVSEDTLANFSTNEVGNMVNHVALIGNFTIMPSNRKNAEPTPLILGGSLCWNNLENSSLSQGGLNDELSGNPEDNIISSFMGINELNIIQNLQPEDIYENSHHVISTAVDNLTININSCYISAVGTAQSFAIFNAVGTAQNFAIFNALGVSENSILKSNIGEKLEVKNHNGINGEIKNNFFESNFGEKLEVKCWSGIEGDIENCIFENNFALGFGGANASGANNTFFSNSTSDQYKYNKLLEVKPGLANDVSIPRPNN